jgi:ribonuclease G
MGNSLVINRSPSEIRVALLENSETCEVYVERERERGVVGNVYRGKVARVLPGMQAAFVEIGLERTGFLYVDDSTPRDETHSDSDAGSAAKEGDSAPQTGVERGRFRSAPVGNIGDFVSKGQDILVQVQKDPLGTKGARLTRHVSLPGRHIVYMPFSDHVGVSHRIEPDEERQRLKVLLEQASEGDDGFIAQTAAEGVDDDTLVREAKLLAQMWKDIEKRGNKGK